MDAFVVFPRGWDVHCDLVPVVGLHIHQLEAEYIAS